MTRRACGLIYPICPRACGIQGVRLISEGGRLLDTVVGQANAHGCGPRWACYKVGCVQLSLLCLRLSAHCGWLVPLTGLSGPIWIRE